MTLSTQADLVCIILACRVNPDAGKTVSISEPHVAFYDQTSSLNHFFLLSTTNLAFLGFPYSVSLACRVS